MIDLLVADTTERVFEWAVDLGIDSNQPVLARFTGLPYREQVLTRKAASSIPGINTGHTIAKYMRRVGWFLEKT